VAVVILAIYLDRVTAALVNPNPIWRLLRRDRSEPVGDEPSLQLITGQKAA